MVAVRLCPLLVSVSRLWCLASWSRSLCPGLRCGIPAIEFGAGLGSQTVGCGGLIGVVRYFLLWNCNSLRSDSHVRRIKTPHHPARAAHGGPAEVEDFTV